MTTVQRRAPTIGEERPFSSHGSGMGQGSAQRLQHDTDPEPHPPDGGSGSPVSGAEPVDRPLTRRKEEIKFQ